MKKENRAKILRISTGVIAGGLIAGAVIEVYYTMDRDNIPQIPVYVLPKFDDDINGVNFVNNSINHDTKKDGQYFLSDEGVEVLKARISNDLDYGPEFWDLNGIIIDGAGTVKEANGYYTPRFDTINLSSEFFLKQGLHTVAKNAKADFETDVKVELMFQVFFHEYGHFMANKYLMSEPQGSKNEIDVSSVQKTAKSVGKWNSDFYNKFTTALKYNDDKSKPLILDARNPSSLWKSIGSVYTAYDIYNKINYSGSNAKNAKAATWDEAKGITLVQAGTSPILKIDQTQKSVDANKVDLSKLPYYYSIDELVTRRYEQILYAARPQGKADISDSFITAGENYSNKPGVLSSGFHWWKEGPKAADGRQPYRGEPTVIYQDRFTYKDLDGNFMNDDPTVPSTRDSLYDLYAKHIGISDDKTYDDFTTIYNVRNTKTHKDDKYRFGGFMDNNVSDKTFLRVDGKDYPLIIKKSNMTLYSKFGTDTPAKQPAGFGKKFWVLATPLNQKQLDSIIGKPMHLIDKVKNKDGDEVEKEIKTDYKVRSGLNGITTTYRSSHKNKYDYYIHKDIKGNIIISNGSGA